MSEARRMTLFRSRPRRGPQKQRIAFTAFVLVLFAPYPATAGEDTLRQRVEATIAADAPGARIGLLVETEDGREVIAIAPDARYVPASNT